MTARDVKKRRILLALACGAGALVVAGIVFGILAAARHANQPSEEVNTDQISTEWGRRYDEYLQKRYASNPVQEFATALVDFNADDIPELIVRDTANSNAKLVTFILYYANSEVKMTSYYYGEETDFRIIYPIASESGPEWQIFNTKDGKYGTYFGVANMLAGEETIGLSASTDEAIARLERKYLVRNPELSYAKIKTDEQTKQLAQLIREADGKYNPAQEINAEAQAEINQILSDQAEEARIRGENAGTSDDSESFTSGTSIINYGTYVATTEEGQATIILKNDDTFEYTHVNGEVTTGDIVSRTVDTSVNEYYQVFQDGIQLGDDVFVISNETNFYADNLKFKKQ